MFKISFKEKDGHPSKIVQRFNDKVTQVTLNAIVLSDYFRIGGVKMYLKEIMKHPYIVSNAYFTPEHFSIQTVGKAKRAEGDDDNPLLAERIAESRAKIKMYKFALFVLKRYCKKYYEDLYGSSRSMPEMGWGGLFGEIGKYKRLLYTEQEHLNALFREA